MKNLDELLELMISDHPSAMCAQDPEAWSTDLPTFGGEGPACTLGVWSWDETRLLIGTCNDDLEIVRRKDTA
tara:strand:+ start:306 stop:521 length:216 start_codon:yes stop_codon:yes gene_type:complete